MEDRFTIPHPFARVIGQGTILLLLLIPLAGCLSVPDFTDLLAMTQGTPDQDPAIAPASPPPEPAPAASSPRSPTGATKPITSPAPATTKGKPVKSTAIFARFKDSKAGTRQFGPGQNPATTKASLYTLKDGAWALYRSTTKEGTAYLSMATFNKDGLWIYEVVSYQPTAATVIQMAIQGFETVVRTGRTDAMDILWIRVMDEQGEITILEGAMVKLMGGMYTDSLRVGPSETTTFGPGGLQSVPIGTFPVTWLATSTWKTMGKTEQGRVWMHTEAPLFHLVRSESDNGASLMELCDGADQGYKTVLP